MTYLLVCFGQKTGARPPFFTRHHWLTSWIPFPPLLMSICWANCNRISFSWTAFSVVFLLLVGRPLRSIGRCGEAFPPEWDVFKIAHSARLLRRWTEFAHCSIFLPELQTSKFYRLYFFFFQYLLLCGPVREKELLLQVLDITRCYIS